MVWNGVGDPYLGLILTQMYQVFHSILSLQIRQALPEQEKWWHLYPQGQVSSYTTNITTSGAHSDLLHTVVSKTTGM